MHTELAAVVRSLHLLPLAHPGFSLNRGQQAFSGRVVCHAYHAVSL